MTQIRSRLTRFALALTLAAPALPALADEPSIDKVVATKVGMGWRFEVTISHPDTGWDDYADGWEVIDADGTRLGFRKLLHPHVDEQPFTRSLSGVVVPDGVREVYVRARDNVGGWGTTRVPVRLDVGG